MKLQACLGVIYIYISSQITCAAEISLGTRWFLLGLLAGRQSTWHSALKAAEIGIRETQPKMDRSVIAYDSSVLVGFYLSTSATRDVPFTGKIRSFRWKQPWVPAEKTAESATMFGRYRRVRMYPIYLCGACFDYELPLHLWIGTVDVWWCLFASMVDALSGFWWLAAAR